MGDSLLRRGLVLIAAALASTSCARKAVESPNQIRPGDRVVTVRPAPFKTGPMTPLEAVAKDLRDKQVVLSAPVERRPSMLPAGMELVAESVGDNGVGVTISSKGQTVTGYVCPAYLAGGPEVTESEFVERLQEEFEQHARILVSLTRATDGKELIARTFLMKDDSDWDSQWLLRTWVCELRSEAAFQAASDFLVGQAESLVLCGGFDEPWITDSPSISARLERRGPKKVTLEYRVPRRREVKVGTSACLVLSEEAQRYLFVEKASDYPASRHVVIVGEPHHDTEAQFSLFKGLKVLFSDNPSILAKGKTVFLAEGYPAGQILSVDPLVQVQPKPTDWLIRETLGTCLIPGYVAYEWKHQHGIPIVGHEDAELHRICARLHVHYWREIKDLPGGLCDPYRPGALPLKDYSVFARNDSIANALFAHLEKFEYPILFIGNGHVQAEGNSLRFDADYWERSKRVLIASELGRLRGANVRGLVDFLKDRGIGYSLLRARSSPLIEEDIVRSQLTRYMRLMQAQVEGKPDAYVRGLGPIGAHVTVSPTPELAARLVSFNKNERGGPPSPDPPRRRPPPDPPNEPRPPDPPNEPLPSGPPDGPPKNPKSAISPSTNESLPPAIIQGSAEVSLKSGASKNTESEENGASNGGNGKGPSWLEKLKEFLKKLREALKGKTPTGQGLTQRQEPGDSVVSTDPISQLGRPRWANTAAGFVNWLKNLSKERVKLTGEQADAIAADAKGLGIYVRLDPPHPGTPWDVPHFNIGREGQVHLEVPRDYMNPTVPTGTAQEQ